MGDMDAESLVSAVLKRDLDAGDENLGIDESSILHAVPEDIGNDADPRHSRFVEDAVNEIVAQSSVDADPAAVENDTEHDAEEARPPAIPHHEETHDNGHFVDLDNAYM